jgi:aspartate aminotransferase-like enzyme
MPFKPKTKNQKPKTKNQLTMPVSAPGSAGMESVFVNLVEPGDKVIVCQNGVSAAYAAKCETLRR